MHLESAEDLIQALRASGLFTPEQFDALARDVAPPGTDATVVLKHLIKSDRVTRYQLKKVLNGRVADLFVGPYIVTDKLGAGGMGKVYRARDAAGNPLALKVVRPALVANPIVRGRYAREVEATRNLDHPNIVRVFDAGAVDGKFYLAMEFVDGIDLARLMHDYAMLGVVEACEYARQAALGLQHAHDCGFVHRDVKPSNIVVAGERYVPQATEPAVVKLLDLGLARAMDPDDMVAPDLTRDHTVVGTPDYMAPEQAKNSKQVDARADLYSLGCTLYFLLTGRVPFTGKTAIEKILAHQAEPPPPLQALRPDVPMAVAEIVVRLMAKRPEDRIQSAGELAILLAPHAKYPEGALPVDIDPIRDRTTDTPPIGATTSASGTEPTSFPAPSLGSSVGSISPLELSEVNLPGIGGPAPVAPSDRTPRPRTPVPSAKGKQRRPSNRKHRRHRAGASRDVPPVVWVVAATIGAAIVALVLWRVANP